MKKRAWVLLGVVVAAACTGGDDERPASTTAAVPSTAAPAATTEPLGGEAADAVRPDLPVLEDYEPPPWEPATRTEEIASELSSGTGDTVQLAVDAFGLLVDGMPGVSPTDLPPGEGLSGSFTLGLIRSVRDELAPEQAAVLDEYLAAGTVVGRVRADGTIEVSEGPPGPTDESTTTGSVATSTDADGLSRLRSHPAVPIDLEYLDLLAEVIARWDAHLPDRPKHDIELRIVPSKKAEMNAMLGDVPGTCVVSVLGGFFQSNPSDDEIRFFFAHELFHCMQFAWGTSGFVTHAWLYDGSADWAAADLYRDRSLTYDGLGVGWFTFAGYPLSAREYGAWPLFENARISGYPVYDYIRSMFESPQKAVSAILQVGHLDGQVFRMYWSSRTLRSSTLGSDWQLPWPTPSPDAGPHDNIVSIGSRGTGIYKVSAAGEYRQQQLTVRMTPQVGIVVVAMEGGPLTTHTAIGTQTVGDGGSRRFCFAPDGCRCPGGSTSGAVEMDGPDMIFSFAASENETVAHVVGESWDPDNHCRDEPEPEEASSNGDPHLVSFDGLPFDVITLGEFVTARDPEGDLEVQTRHEPFQFGAGTTAVAIGSGDHRVSFTMPEFFTVASPLVRVDGEVMESTEFDVGDMRIAITDGDAGSEIVATWPDGSAIELRWFLGWFVQLRVTPERAARMEGLLGSADGDLGNDLALPDGTLVDSNDAAQDESPFALAWAVDGSTTLFDYDAGQSVRTFRIPHPNPEPPELDAAALAECSDSLGERAAAHEISSCAYDVTVTGDEGFVEEYATIVEERVARSELVVRPDAVPTTTGSPAAESQGGVPTLTLTRADPSGSVDVAAGTVLVARAASCDVGFVDLVVRHGDELARAALCDPQGLPAVGAGRDDEWIEGEAYVWLPDAREYAVSVDPFLADDEAPISVEVFVDPDPVVLRTSELTEGDRRTLTAIADTVVYLTDPGDTFDAAGFDVACAVAVYWLEEFPHPDPRDLGICDHPGGIDFPPTDRVAPVVVFNRTGDDVVVVELTRTG